jgi:hypothetical protein
MAVRVLLVLAVFAVLYGCGHTSSSVTTVKEPTTPETAPPTAKPATSTVAPASASASAGMSSEEQAAQSETDCRLLIYVAQENMSRQKAKVFSELLADMIRTMETPSWTSGSLRNTALDHLGVPRYPECKQEHVQQSNNITLTVRPINGAGVSGVATFRDVDDGLAVKLALHSLPKPNAFYLAHVHPGTCAQGQAQGEEEEEHHQGEHGGATGQEIEWPLSEVRSDAHGNGSSTTTLKDTSMEKLFSGQPKHVNVHAVGSGNPLVLACADLKR